MLKIQEDNKIKMMRTKLGKDKKNTTVYNHPMLKFYIEEQAKEQREQMEMYRLKLKMFQTIKW